MTKEETKAQIDALTKELQEHSYRYYVLNEPTISDYQYDMMMKGLEKLEEEYPDLASPDSPTQRVGSDLAEDYYIE
ncbi:MAG: hypothetical protein FWG84_06605 [Bacteroidales bacterium]|nr:hypothetical protein [Bacteroidales bacterium]